VGKKETFLHKRTHEKELIFVALSSWHHHHRREPSETAAAAAAPLAAAKSPPNPAKELG